MIKNDNIFRGIWVGESPSPLEGEGRGEGDKPFAMSSELVELSKPSLSPFSKGDKRGIRRRFEILPASLCKREEKKYSVRPEPPPEADEGSNG